MINAKFESYCYHIIQPGKKRKIFFQITKPWSQIHKWTEMRWKLRTLLYWDFEFFCSCSKNKNSENLKSDEKLFFSDQTYEKIWKSAWLWVVIKLTFSSDSWIYHRCIEKLVSAHLYIYFFSKMIWYDFSIYFIRAMASTDCY